MSDDKQKREEQGATDLGPRNLGDLRVWLATAIELNEREIPEETLTRIPIPSLSKVRDVPVSTMRDMRG